MTEQFPPLPLYMTLEEAAAAISARLGQQWTVSNILDRAANGEISIFARIPTDCRLVRCEPMEGKPNEIDAPAGSWPRISAKAARALLLDPAASFDELTYPRTIDFLGEPLEVMATVWELAPGETAPEFTVTDCRVSGAAALELAKRYGGKAAITPTPAPAEEVAADEKTQASDNRGRPPTKKQTEIDAVLASLARNRFDPLALPVGNGKKSGAKKAVWDDVGAEFTSYDAFNSRWRQMKKCGLIADAK